MVANIKKTDTQTPLGQLAVYGVTQTAIPRDPRDTSGQIPTYSATIANTVGDSKTLIGEHVTLEDWTGTVIDGTVTQVSKGGQSGISQLDSTSIFSKINTDQTTLPIVVDETQFNPGEAVFRHWLLKCGISEYRIDGTLLHYIAPSNWSPSDWVGTGGAPTYDLSSWGYSANSVPQWKWVGSDTDSSAMYTATTGTYMNPLEVNPVQGIVLGGSFQYPVAAQEFRVSTNILSTGANVVYTLRRATNTWSLVEKIGSAAETILATANWTRTQNAPMWVFCQINANVSDPTKIDVMFRFMEKDTVTGAQYTTDSAVTTGVVSLLRNRPRPFQLNRLGVLRGFIANQPTLQTAYPNAQIQVSLASGSTYKAQKHTAYTPGFTGNVWDKIREYCSIFDIDVFLQNGLITFRDKDALGFDGTNYIPMSPISKEAFIEQANNRESAKYVQVDFGAPIVDSNGVNNNLIWKADSVYSLNQGELQVQTVQTNASFASVSQPVMVTGVPVPYTLSTGAYVVTGADGFIVDPTWWANNGGSLVVAPTKNSGELTITMQAPSVSTTRAPYRISEGVADRPAIYVRGQGIKFDTNITSVVSATGAANAAAEIGTNFKSTFVTSKLIATNVCAKLAVAYGNSESYATFNVKRAEYVPGVDKTPVGHSIYYNGSAYRVTQQTTDHAGFTINRADRNNTLRIINGEYWTGKTIHDWNILFGGKKLRTVNVAPLPHYES